jgi:hypothetical protein
MNKYKVVPVHSKQAYRASVGTGELYANFCTTWRRVRRSGWPHGLSLGCEGKYIYYNIQPTPHKSLPLMLHTYEETFGELLAVKSDP